MFKNYFKTALRHLLRDKLFSGLNILSLATGMSCGILIFLWVHSELSFDTFTLNADRIFRVTDKASDQEYAIVPPSLAYVTIMIAFATVSFQAIKAAVANPVKSLRTQ